MTLKAIGIATMFVMAGAGSASAVVYHFYANLKGSNEVPPSATQAKGEFSAVLYTTRRVLNYTATYSGVPMAGASGQFETRDSHGPSAPVALMMDSGVSPTSGTAHLSDAQIKDLMAGRWYFNVRTSAHPVGEIGGRLRRDDN
jgi:hypothetical protein